MAPNLSLNRRELFRERFPAIAFLLAHTPCSSVSNKRYSPSANLSEELKQFNGQFLYVYGLGLGEYYPITESWLNEKKERAVIFIEDELSSFDAFLKEPISEKVLKNRQIHLYYYDQESSLSDFAEGCSDRFPSDQIAVIALEEYRKNKSERFNQLKLALMRTSTTFHAQVTDALFSHALFANFTKNAPLIAESFCANSLAGQFKNIPAIICGAGPSLADAKTALKKLEQNALIFAGGSAISALAHQGVEPHFSIAIDPNAEEYERLKGMGAMMNPLLYSLRILPDVFQLTNSPLGYLKSQTSGLIGDWLERSLSITEQVIGPELGKEALTVISLSLSLAVHLGCNPIILTGVDLAFTDNKLYAPGVMHTDIPSEARASQQIIERIGRTKKNVTTSVKWVMESDVISAYAKLHPEVEFLDATREGLGFQEIPLVAWQELMNRFANDQHDLRAQVHALIENSCQFSFTADAISNSLEELGQSLKNCEKIIEEMLVEIEKNETEGKENLSGRALLFEHEIEEELAYSLFLQTTKAALSRIFTHYPQPEESLKIEKLYWQRYQFVVKEKLKLLDRETAYCVASEH